MIILLPPLFDHDVCLPPIGKDPTIQTFAAKRPIEALDEGVFPGTTRCDVQGVTVRIPQPFFEGMSDKLRAVVTAQVAWSAPQQE